MYKRASLTPEAQNILLNQSTEAAGSSPLQSTVEYGTYCCRLCGIALFRSHHQFASSCGWPSFDDEIPDRLLRLPDKDGRRMEIACERCKSHLGHVFHGEAYTDKNTRHCVNGLALDLVNSDSVLDTEEAIYAGGCFWGVEYWMNQQPGVVLTEAGYIGGHPCLAVAVSDRVFHHQNSASRNWMQIDGVNEKEQCHIVYNNTYRTLQWTVKG